MRNLLATLLLSQGVPMLCAGDEMRRTQGGNNNAYCQDNEISWIDWNLDRPARDLLTFTRFVSKLRRRHPVFRRRQFFFGRPIQGSEVKDLTWFRADGKEMTQDDWTNPITRCLGLRLAGDAIVESDSQGRRIVDDTFLVMLNAHHEGVGFTLPAHRASVCWETVLDTREATGKPKRRVLHGGDVYEMQARSFAVLRLRGETSKREDEHSGEAEGDMADNNVADNSGGTPGPRVRVNTANPQELLEVPGFRPEDAEAIVRFRDEHGPIKDAAQLSGVLGGRELDAPTRERIDFAPATLTAPEAPGA